MDNLPLLRKSYLTLLRLEPAQRLFVQEEMCELRNAISKITGLNAEDTQNYFEGIVTEHNKPVERIAGSLET